MNDQRALPETRLDRRDLLILLALILPVVVFFANPLFTGRVFYYRDVARFFHPNAHYAADRLRQGQLPLWNPYCFCGHPFLASWYPGALYPLSAITVVFPLPHSLTAFILLHSYLSLVTMYLLVRSLGCARPAAVVSALVFGLSGFALSAVDNPNTLTGLAWAPLVLLLVRRALCRPSLGRAVPAAVVIALQILAGGPEMVYFTWMICGLYGLAKLLSDRRFQAGRAVWRRRLAVLAVCFGLGALLAAAQLVPFAEVFFHSARGRGMGLIAGSGYAVPPRDLARFIVPDLMTTRLPIGLKWTSQVWLKSFYLGLVPLVLSGIALVRVRGRRTWFFAGLAALGMVLACGERTPLWVLAYYGLPGLSGTRYPVKFMMMATFSIAILAGLGAHWLIQADPGRRRRTVLGAMVGVLLVQVAVAVAVPLVERVPSEPYQNTGQSLTRTGLALGAVLVSLFWLAAVSRSVGRRRGWTLRAPALALGLVLIADTYHHHQPQVMTAHPNIYRTRPKSLDVIDALPKPSRVFFEPAVRHWLEPAAPSAAGDGDPLLLLREILIRNLPMLYKVESVHGFTVILPWRFRMLYDRLRKRYDPRELPLIDFLNAGLLIYAPDRDAEPSLDAIRFEKNPEALPRAMIVRQRAPERFADEEALVTWLVSRSFQPLEEVHLDRSLAPPPASDQKAVAADRVEILRHEPERIVIRVESVAPGYLVVSDQYSPGWRATVAGRPAEIARANLCFRAVAIPKGAFTVEMAYRPWTVTLGFGLSGAAAVLAALLVVADRIRRRAPAAPSPQPAVGPSAGAGNSN